MRGVERGAFRHLSVSGHSVTASFGEIAKVTVTGHVTNRFFEGRGVFQILKQF